MDGENGLLTKAGDVPAVAAALGRLVADPARRQRLAAAARAECRRIYSWEAVGVQIMGVYAALRGQPQAAFDTTLPVLPCRFRAEPHLL